MTQRWQTLEHFWHYSIGEMVPQAVTQLDHKLACRDCPNISASTVTSLGKSYTRTCLWQVTNTAPLSPRPPLPFLGSLSELQGLVKLLS